MAIFKVTKQKVSYCGICGLDHFDKSKGDVVVDGAEIEIFQDHDPKWSSARMSVCGLCLATLIQLNNIISNNKLQEAAIASILHNEYIPPQDQMVEGEANNPKDIF